ncbi:MAG: flagellar biosynthesis regulator FlaF [Pseudooceanicola sp.]
MSVAAYKRTIRESESPRQIEARVFARITGDLRDNRADFDAAQTREARIGVLSGGLGKALRDNQKLWTYLRDDLAQPGNQLPPQLRAQLLSIALWVDRQTAQVMGGAQGLSALIDVNAHILAGLTRANPESVQSHGTQPHAETF